jgi:hydrogenase maturation protease
MKNIDRENLNVFGIGNSGRGDDGLGWKFLDLLGKRQIPVTTHYRYQLQIEDAELISRFPKIVFIDSSKKDLPEGYSWKRVLPELNGSFTTHLLKPEYILYLCKDLYLKEPAGFILGIQGYHWELGDTISPKASVNLLKALSFFEDIIYDKR